MDVWQIVAQRKKEKKLSDGEKNWICGRIQQKK